MQAPYFDNNLLEFKSRLKSILGDNLTKLILFGSRARKEHDESSDYDLLVLLKDNSEKIKDQILDIEGDLLFENNAVFSAFSFSELEFNKKLYEPFIINALKEGVEL